MQYPFSCNVKILTDISGLLFQQRTKSLYTDSGFNDLIWVVYLHKSFYFGAEAKKIPKKIKAVFQTKLR